MQTIKLEYLYSDKAESKSTYISSARQIYESSFPEDERRDFNLIKALDKNTELDFCIITNNQSVVIGILSYWNFDTFVYIEHFATQEEKRGLGIGSKILTELVNTFSKPIVLEIELPENALAKRRMEFYQRHGFAPQPYNYVQPPYDKTKQSVPMLIMTKSKEEISKECYYSIIKELHQKVYNFEKQA
jgi:GNAT superfamily N-acetyltransferase